MIPLVELLEKGERAIDEVIDVMGRATIEAVLRMSAEQVAGRRSRAVATPTGNCTGTGCRRGVWR